MRQSRPSTTKLFLKKPLEERLTYSMFHSVNPDQHYPLTLKHKARQRIAPMIGATPLKKFFVD